MSKLGSPDYSEYEALVKEHQAGLRAFVRALGVDEAWVDDVAQEVFIVAFRKFDDFRTGTDFGKWLRSIARNLAANERRKEARHSRLVSFAVADLLSEQSARDDRPGESIDLLLPALQACVEKLPVQNRELLRRRYAASETAQDLARVLCVKADAIRQTLLRIRVAVKRCIEKSTGGAWL